MKGGRTFHSRFKAPNCVNDIDFEDEYFTINKGTGLAELLKQTKLIIFDEITTLSKRAIECLNRTLQFVMDNNEFMGGLLIVLMGDFKQCLHIVKGIGHCPAAVINACMNHTELWHKFVSFELTKNMRLKGY